MLWYSYTWCIHVWHTIIIVLFTCMICTVHWDMWFCVQRMTMCVDCRSWINDHKTWHAFWWRNSILMLCCNQSNILSALWYGSWGASVWRNGPCMSSRVCTPVQGVVYKSMVSTVRSYEGMESKGLHVNMKGDQVPGLWWWSSCPPEIWHLLLCCLL